VLPVRCKQQNVFDGDFDGRCPSGRRAAQLYKFVNKDKSGNLQRKFWRKCGKNMQNFNVIILKQAKQDLVDIVQYLNGFSDNIGAKYYDLITEKILSLEIMPERHSLVRNERLRKLGFRWAYVKNYVIFFTVDTKKSEVMIKRVLYSRREYDALL